MNLKELSHDEYKNIAEKFKSGEAERKLYIRQGGAEEFAKYGLQILADELQNDRERLGLKNPAIFISSGTGVSALYLSLLSDFEVFTTNCVGNAEYLLEQFSQLSSDEKHFPTILKTSKKYHFGNLYEDLLEMYTTTKKSGIEFDLLYDCKMWLAIKEHIESFKERDLLFIHTGGVDGNKSQLKRYAQKEYFDFYLGLRV